VKPIADMSEMLLLLGLDDSATTRQRALAQLCIRRAEAAVRSCIGYDPVRTSRTEFYPQGDMSRSGRTAIWEVDDTSAYIRQLSEASTDELQLKHLPLREITHLYIDYDGRGGQRTGSFAAGTEKVLGQDFWMSADGLDSDGDLYSLDGILRSHGRWPDIAGSVKVVYEAGYSDNELHGNDDVLDASAILESVTDEATRRFHKALSRAKRRLAGFSGPVTSESLGDYSYSADSAMLSALVGTNLNVAADVQIRLQEGGFTRFDMGVM